MLVAYSHLFSELIWWKGTYAVFCFYLISGYLMSLILNEVYIENSDKYRYMANRALRIFPPYLAVMFLSAIAAYLFSENLTQEISDTVQFKDVISHPNGIGEWIANITLIYGLNEPLAVSQSWSLQVELVFYVAMIFLVRRFYIVIFWCVASLSYLLYLDHVDATFYERYSTIFGSSMAFSLGSLIYYSSKRIEIGGHHILIATLLYIIHLFFADYIWGFESRNLGFILLTKPQSYGLYANLFLGGYLLYAIVCHQEKKSKLFSFGKVLGDIAYAVFLLHWLVALLLLAVGVPFEKQGYFLFVSFVAINIAALVLYLLVERPVNLYFRDKIRSSLLTNSSEN